MKENMRLVDQVRMPLANLLLSHWEISFQTGSVCVVLCGPFVCVTSRHERSLARFNHCKRFEALKCDGALIWKLYSTEGDWRLCLAERKYSKLIWHPYLNCVTNNRV